MKLTIGTPAPHASSGWAYVRDLPRLGVSVYQRPIVTDIEVDELAELFNNTQVGIPIVAPADSMNDLMAMLDSMNMNSRSGGRRRKRTMRKSRKLRKSRKSRR